MDDEMKDQESGKSIARQTRAWMPWTLRAPFLCSLAGFFLIFFITLEGLRQYSERNQGLVIHKTVAEIPRIISVAYVYVPVSVAVLAVNLWNFFVSDALRLELYFQLAKPEGVPATVLFTNYRFCYGFMTPLVVARNRHWLVFSISTLSTIFRSLLPSLLSGLLVLTELPLSQTYTVSTWPKLLDKDTQINWFVAEALRFTSASVMTSADDFFLLRSSDYATATVSMPLDENETSILSLNQTVYWSELACQDVALANNTWEQRATTNLEMESDSGAFQMWRATQIEFHSKGDEFPCRVEFALNRTTFGHNGSSQLRYWEPMRPRSVFGYDTAFQTTNCERYALLGLLIETKDNDQNANGHASNATAFACTANCRAAEAELSISVNASIIDARIDTPSQTDLREIEFFSPGFQNLLFHESRGPVNSTSRVLDDATRSLVDPRLLIPSGANLSLGLESSSVRTGVAEYQNEITQFWKSKFIITFNKLFDTTAAATPLKASQVTVVVALNVLSKPAIMAEISLVAAALLLLSLAAVYPRRANFLRSDPGSIAVHRVKSSAQPPPGNSFYGPKIFVVNGQVNPKDRKIDIAPLSSSLSSALPPARRNTDRRPHFAALPWFLVECILLIGTLVTYGFAVNFTSLENLNTESTQQLGPITFLLFAPTLISSLVSSLFASILRHIALIEPWGRLQKGMAPAGGSLAINYGSQTPISVLIHTLRRGPLPLTALSIICTLSLLLSIVSGGMFEPQIKDYRTPATGLSAQYNGTIFQLPTHDVQFDGRGLLLSSMNRGTPIVPWQDASYSFLPLTNSKLDADVINNVKYAAITIGTRANLDCQQVPFNQSWIDRESGNMSWNYTGPAGLTCTMEAPNRAVEAGLMKRSILYLQPSELSSAEPRCEAAFLLLARWETIEFSLMNQQNSVALYCEPSIAGEKLEVIFDPQGIISSYKPTTALTVHGQQTAHNFSQSFLADFNRAAIGFAKTNTSHPEVLFSHYDWPAMLIMATYDQLHPSAQPAFDPAFLMLAAQSAYQQMLSSYLTINRDLYFWRYSESAAPVVEGTMITSLWGLLPSVPSIIIALVLLSLDVVMLTLVFATRSTYFRAPRVPNSIGSLIPWIADSEMSPDFRGMSRMGKSEWQGYLERIQRVYRFGLPCCSDGHERWLLDYEHAGHQEAGSELDEMPAISPVENPLHGQSSQA